MTTQVVYSIKKKFEIHNAEKNVVLVYDRSWFLDKGMRLYFFTLGETTLDFRGNWSSYWEYDLLILHTQDQDVCIREFNIRELDWYTEIKRVYLSKSKKSVILRCCAYDPSYITWTEQFELRNFLK
jgi:hypothetical protein